MAVDPAALDEALSELDPSTLVQGALDASLGRVVESLQQVFGADGAGIMLVDDEHGLRFVSATDEVSATLEAIETRVGDGPCVEALWHGEPVLCADLAAERRWPEVREALVPMGARAILGMPLRVGGAPVGALDVYRKRTHEWAPAALDAVAAFNLLRSQARHERRKVAEVAEDVLGRNRPATSSGG